MENGRCPLVSVIIPVYNGEAYLARAVDSLLMQSFPDFELILIDDGSTDGSGQLCDVYAEKDPRVRVLHSPNEGLCAARNRGLESARGEYILFVDCDDTVEQDYIHNLLPQGGEDLVYAGYQNFLSDGTVVCCRHPDGCICCEELRNNFLAHQITFVWCGCYRRDIIVRNDIRFDAAALLWEDVMFNLRYLEHCTQVRFSSAANYRYNQNPNSLINRFHPDRLEKNKAECRAVEAFSHRGGGRIRWFYWNATCNHYRKYSRAETLETRKIARKRLNQTFRDPFFRECIPEIRAEGSLDERVETFFLSRLRWPFYRPFYRCVLWLYQLKKMIQ